MFPPDKALAKIAYNDDKVQELSHDCLFIGRLDILWELHDCIERDRKDPPYDDELRFSLEHVVDINIFLCDYYDYNCTYPGRFITSEEAISLATKNSNKEILKLCKLVIHKYGNFHC